MFEAVLTAVLPFVALGALVGAVAQFTTFCSVGAVADVILANDWRRARSWIIAAAVALVGAQFAAANGLAPLDRSIYLPPGTSPLLAIVGGVAFGYGMSLAGGCLQRALVRIGGGSIKSLLTVAIMAASAVPASYASNAISNMPGVWGRIAWPEKIPATLDGLIAAASGLQPYMTTAFVAPIIAVGMLIFCLKDGWFRKSPGHLWGGVAIGLAVVVMWLQDTPLPRGMNLLVDLIYTGRALVPPYQQYDIQGVGVPALAYALVGCSVLLGIVLGSFVVALLRKDLFVDRFVDREDLKRHIVGGLLMGVGGAMAYGCTFGQGLSGFSTLSITSFIAIAGMITGCIWGIRALEAGSAWGGLRLCFGRAG